MARAFCNRSEDRSRNVSSMQRRRLFYQNNAHSRTEIKKMTRIINEKIKKKKRNVKRISSDRSEYMTLT